MELPNLARLSLTTEAKRDADDDDTPELPANDRAQPPPLRHLSSEEMERQLEELLEKGKGEGKREGGDAPPSDAAKTTPPKLPVYQAPRQKRRSRRSRRQPAQEGDAYTTLPLRGIV
jgi:hypothetical protein